MATSRFSRILNRIGPTDDTRSPLWNIRISPAIALVSIVLAGTVWKSGFAHGICLGLAAGQLATLCAVSFRITGVTYNDPQDPKLQQLHLTR